MTLLVIVALIVVSLSGCRTAHTQELPPTVVHPPTRIVFGGDVMLSRHVGRVIRQQKDPAWPFRQIAPYMSAADIAFVNLEAPFSDRGDRVLKGMVFKAEPETVD